MMHIAFLNSIEKETYGGMEEWIGLVASGLVARGHSVSLIGRPGSRFLERVKGGVPGAAIVPLDISGDFNPVTIAGLKRYLSGEAVDILSVNFNKDVRLGGIAAWLCRSVKVVWSAGIDITKDNFVHRLLTPRLIDSVIVPSRSLKGEITRHGYIDPKTVEVIPIGIAEKPVGKPAAEARERLRRKYDLSEDAIIAVTVGRFVDHKGHTYLIDAAPAIVKRHPKIVFMFLGDGYQKEKHREHIAQLKLDKHFVFAGMLDEMDLELGGADLMVHPSIIEPFGIVLLEGMRAGLPIIASSVGGIPEVVNGEHAILIEPGDSDQIAKAVIGLLDSASRRDAFSRAAQKRWRENFTIDIMLNKVENYFSGIVLGEDERKPV